MYKPKMKQRLSCLMAFIMLFSFTGMKVFANKSTIVAPAVQAERSVDMVSEDPIDTNEETITISANADGTFSSTASVPLRAGALQVRASAEYDDIYTTSDSRYFQEVSNDTYQEVQPVGGELTAYSTYQTIEILGLPEEVMAGIAQMAAVAEKNNIADACVTVFVPSAEKQNSARATTQIYPRTATIWDGKTFYHYQVYFTGLDFNGFEVLSSAEIDRSRLKSALNVVLVIVKEIGMMLLDALQERVEEVISIFSIGFTMLDAWNEMETGHINYHNPENSVKASGKYRLHQKYTYYYDETVEHFGCRSQRVFLQELVINITLHTDEGNTGVDTRFTPNASIESPYYSNPEELAYLNYINVGYFDNAMGEFEVGNDKCLTIDFIDKVLVEWPSGWPTRPPIEP